MGTVVAGSFSCEFPSRKWWDRAGLEDDRRGMDEFLDKQGLEMDGVVTRGCWNVIQLVFIRCTKEEYDKVMADWWTGELDL